MTLEEFLKELPEEISLNQLKVESRYGYGRQFKRTKNVAPDALIYERWVIGGITGGSCWGTSPDTPVSAEDEPAFSSLDMILEKICPDIKFLQYKKLIKMVEKREEDNSGRGDCYGNHTDYMIKYIVLQDLYNALVELDLLNGK